MGTIFEDSHLPLRLWLQAIHLLCSSKKGISTRQLQRTLGCGMKTAWHLGHRIRFAMDPGAVRWPAGRRWQDRGGGRNRPQQVAQDQAPAGFRRKTPQSAGYEPCGTRRQYPFDHAGSSQRHERRAQARAQGQPPGHRWRGALSSLPPVAKHEIVDHSKFEWARGDVHTNTLEGFFSVLKRGLVGVYQHVDNEAP